jgi:hypothetical protein
MTFSVFITKGNEDMKEHHDLNKEQAMEKYMGALYDHGMLVPNVRVEVRDNNGMIIHSGSNP